MEYALLWRAKAESINNVLESEVLKQFTRAGFDSIKIFGLFPIDSDYATVDNMVQLYLRMNIEDLSLSIQEHISDFDCILPVFEGMQFNNSLSVIADSFDIDKPEMVGFDVRLADGVVTEHPSPLNLAFAQKYVSENLKSCLDYYYDYNRDSIESDAAVFLTDTGIELADPMCKLEYKVFSGATINQNDIKEYVGESNILLTEYVKKCIGSSDHKSIDKMEYALLDRVGYLFEGTQFSYVKLKQMQTLLEQEDWSELENVSGLLALSTSGNLKSKASCFQAISKANLGKIDESFEIVNELFRIHSTDVLVHFLLAKIKYKMGKYEDAADMFEALGQHDLSDDYIIRMMTGSLYKAGYYERALKAAEYLLNVFDWNDNVLRLVLHLSYLTNDMERLEKYGRYLECYPPLDADFPEKEWLIVENLIRDHKKDGWVLDVGANEGLVTEMVLNWGHRCLAFEPDDDLYNQLEQIVSAYPEKAILEKCAVSESEGEAELFIGNVKGFNTLEKKFTEVLDFRFDQKCGSKTVPLKTLESILDKHKVEKVSLLKMDIEGHELSAFKGLGWEKAKNVDFIFIEIEKRIPHNSKALLYYLFASGYRHALVFQHDSANPMFYNMWKLEVNDNINLKPELGVFANIILSRKPFFEFDESYFIDETTVFPVEELVGRLL